MSELSDEFLDRGFVMIEDVISDRDLEFVETNLVSISIGKAGTRNALDFEWCRQIVSILRGDPRIVSLLPSNPVAFQCTYFHKSDDKNWLVPLHRDLSIPIKAKVDGPEWTSWCEKEGQLYCYPPASVLRSLVAIRVHLEDNTDDNGPLQVIPGSHLTDAVDGQRVFCRLKKRGAVVLSPLLLHASSKISSGVRRVLHFVFGPADLPDGADWSRAI